VDDNDRPLDPPVIREAEVVWNPFDDLVPRVDREALRAEQQAKRWGGTGWHGLGA
jgi:peptidyl-prolyl cis-trans isomerase SDCCAG10